MDDDEEEETTPMITALIDMPPTVPSEHELPNDLRCAETPSQWAARLGIPDNGPT